MVQSTCEFEDGPTAYCHAHKVEVMVLDASGSFTNRETSFVDQWLAASSTKKQKGEKVTAGRIRC